MPPARPSAARLIALIAVIAMMLVTLAPPVFGRLPAAAFTVTHGPVSITLANPGSDGHQLGDLRVTSLPVMAADGVPIGRLDSTLTTVGIDAPNEGDEVRISVLIFSFGDGSDQIVVNGSAFYPKAGPTLSTSTTVERPITGGSGRFAGATGWAESEHLDDGTWRHTFHLAGTGWRGVPRVPHHRSELRGAPTASPVADASGGIVRTLLGEVAPSSAAGSTLSLWHYTIPAGEALVPHVHPGHQVARIVSGRLTYNVIDGEATVLRADGTVETATGGDVVVLEAGDSVIENPDLSHFGANEGAEPVVIYAASLFTSGEPPAIPLSSPAP